MRPLRTWLFTPGHRQERVDKALGLPVDAVVLDLEDGVPPGAKEAARATVAAALAQTGPGPARYVRLQAAAGPELAADLAAAVPPATAGICLPKVGRPEVIAALEGPLGEAERAAGLAPGSVRLLVLIETALGLVHAAAIAAAAPRVAALMFGAEDLAADLGLWSAPDEETIRYGRAAVVTAAASQRLQAVDRVFPDFRDAAGLLEDTLRARRLGFTGKAVIHPDQLVVVREAFRPTPAELEAARRVVAAFEAAGGGAIAVDGRMVDQPIVERARRLLEGVHRGDAESAEKAMKKGRTGSIGKGRHGSEG